MADTARKHFGADHVTAGAQRNNVSVYDTITIASIVQAEAEVAAQVVEVDGVERYRPVTAWDAEGDEIAEYREDHPDG